ncbi:hypothetical protein BDN70DRAFT_285586 [Pholiota conissans]|uniref:Heterokaryon incompatibility domain-containing protein n=1 Tax=Pholiota conissans TaxID=109636 RepID=A0A9P6CPR5_9AGAR|nr:hypothetical protein BDN70DRAFT_285586 [Pholiota conissans]
MLDDSNHFEWLTEDDTVPDNERHNYGQSSSAQPKTNLDLLQESISDHISNRMPIRLLRLSSTTGIDLVERAEIQEQAISAMRDLTEEDVFTRIVAHQKADLEAHKRDLQTKLSALGSSFPRGIRSSMSSVSNEGTGPELRRKLEEVERDLAYLEKKSTLSLGWYGARALESGRRNAFEELSDRYVGYAVLSHTWFLPEDKEKEVTHDDRIDAMKKWAEIRTRNGKGYQKLLNFCEVASKKHGISLFWMDTICIDKKNTAELSESIRSMYRWYSESSLCIAYLEHTTSLQDLPADPWFERGWTLQELLAPKKIKFYNKNWQPLTSYHNDKSRDAERTTGILTKISRATGISPSALLSFQPGIKDGIASKMVWAATRKTTKGEDRAYSLMGIFAVSISIAYGEGAERAFFRLVEAILTCFSNTLDVLNCAGKPIAHTIHSSRVLPSGPECYLNHDPDLRLFRIVPRKPLSLTHIGLKVRLLCVEAEIMAPKWGGTKWGTFDGDVRFLCKVSEGSPLWRENPHTFRLRGKHPVLPDQLTSNALVLGIWNFMQQDDEVVIPKRCAAFLLQVSRSQPHSSPFKFGSLSSSHIRSQSKVNTRTPIVFSIADQFSCQVGALSSHGMKLLTVYL